ncbi:hypothetical protein AALP_AA3G273300 [Arabis alpina]|uniref:Pectate lyase superfamily protein domain-containing protein n=1 Tax=Arabis alpina TaxID=50452 RepID=A0A087HC12_ARAAL|nr:hypothetical protein AALP_AA3G273300 [Arabis alpina]
MASRFLILCATYLFFFFLAVSSESSGEETIFDVRNYGGRGDGQRDNAFAFAKTWNEACQWSKGSSTVYIPPGIFFIRQKNPNCRTLAMNLGFAFVRSSKIDGLRSVNSKMGHINFFSVQNFNVTGVTITAPGDSPNTDGIKIGKSKDMHIYNVTIGTGDDCIAILDGTTNLNISDVRCGPGHGISVGSLGRNKGEEDVEGLTVRDSVFNGTSDGLRIKTWAKSRSQILVSNFLYDNIQMINVGNPIIIDQQYCPHGLCDSPGKYDSLVQIKDVKYNKIWGTSTSKEALKIECSKTHPCQDVELSNIDLKYVGHDGLVTALCENVGGSVHGKIVPGDCRI